MQISADMCISEPGCPLSMHLRKAIIAIGLLREVDVIGFLAAMHVFARLTSMWRVEAEGHIPWGHILTSLFHLLRRTPLDTYHMFIFTHRYICGYIHIWASTHLCMQWVCTCMYICNLLFTVICMYLHVRVNMFTSRYLTISGCQLDVFGVT